MKLILDGDLVVGEIKGDGVGIDCPEELQNLPIARLRYINGQIIDAVEYSTFFIAPNSAKHLDQTDPTWQTLTCAWDDEIVLEAGAWRVVTAADALTQSIKREVGRRFRLALKDTPTQMNMAALAIALARKETASTITTSELATLDLLDAAQNWVAATQQTGRDLIAAGDATFADDAHWPSEPSGLSALISAL